MTNFTMLVRNRYTLTRQAITSLMRDTGTLHETFTILDDRSELETSAYLEQWGKMSRVLLLRNSPREQNMGTGELRNLVIKSSEWAFGRGDYLYLSDNDVFFYRHWLELLIEAYERSWANGVRVLGAYNHPFHQHGELLHNGLHWNVFAVNALATQSMLMRWEVWDKYGPFCQTPADKVCQSEDVDFTNKILADGYTIGVVSPPLVVSTGITNTFGEKIPGWELVKAQCPEGVICE
jgi:GT2 family glycosyltransferase